MKIDFTRILDIGVLSMLLLCFFGNVFGFLTPVPFETPTLYALTIILWLLVLAHERSLRETKKAADTLLQTNKNLYDFCTHEQQRNRKYHKNSRTVGLALLRMTALNNVDRAVGTMLAGNEANVLREYALDILAVEEEPCAAS